MGPEFHREVLASAPIPVVVVDGEGRLTYVNGRAVTAYGMQVGHCLVDSFVPGMRGNARAWLFSVRGDDRRSSYFGSYLHTAAGAELFVEATAVDRSGDPAVRGTVVSLVDATAHRERAESLSRLATTDSLTGLVNHRTLLDRLSQVTSGAVAFFDLDNFKLVNDTYGHAVGDSVLVVAASRLDAAFGGDATVARYGGEEFVVLLPEADVEVLAELSRQAAQAVAQPMDMNGSPLTVTVSAGVARIAGNRPEVALRNADAALYAAKAQGRNRVVLHGTDEGPPDARQLSRRVAELEAQNRTDALTGLPNLRAMLEAEQELASNADRTGQPYSVAFVDIDHFGAYNKSASDAAGDRALRSVGQALREALRTGDRVFRKGGEELVVLMPATGRDAALAVGERLRAAVETLDIARVDGYGERMTVTVGLATWTPGATAEELRNQAGSAAFTAKLANRRNSVVAANG